MQPTLTPEKPEKPQNEATPKQTKLDKKSLKRLIFDAFPTAPNVPIYPHKITDKVYRVNWIEGMTGARVVFSRMICLEQTADGWFVRDITVEDNKKNNIKERL